MLLEFFTWLSGTLGGSPGVALSGAFWEWRASCFPLPPGQHPLIVGFIDGQGRLAPRALSSSRSFSAGILITIGLIGLLTALRGA